MRSLEQRHTGRVRESYPEGVGPFALVGAMRRTINDFPPLIYGATQSDGATTSNDGDQGPNEEFDWLKDD